MDNKLKPAIIGGVLLGVLSSIPFVNWLNACCCLWAILGGLLAANLYVKASPSPATAGDGAIVGAIAGVIGAVISLIIGIPVTFLLGGYMNGILIGMLQNMDPSQVEMLRTQMMAGSTLVGAIVNGIIAAVFLLIFSTLGGLIGVSIFEKRKGPMTPPPPPPVSTGPGGFAA